MASVRIAALAIALVASVHAAGAADLALKRAHTRPQVIDHGRPRHRHHHEAHHPDASRLLYEKFLEWLRHH